MACKALFVNVDSRLVNTGDLAHTRELHDRPPAGEWIVKRPYKEIPLGNLLLLIHITT